MPAFRYDDPILERFPAVRGGVIHAVPVSGGASPEPLCAAFGAALEATLEQIGNTPLAEIPSIAAWRRAFAAFGVKPTQYRNAAEALLRRLTKQGTIPSINALVDLGNLVAVRHALPVAVFDQDGIVGGTTVRFATGEERFTDLGSSTTAHPEPGEVVFADDSGAVSARRWCWRQSAESGASSGTSEVLVTIEALDEQAASATEAALEDALALFASYQPRAGIAASLLSADAPSFG